MKWAVFSEKGKAAFFVPYSPLALIENLFNL